MQHIRALDRSVGREERIWDAGARGPGSHGAAEPEQRRVRQSECRGARARRQPGTADESAPEQRRVRQSGAGTTAAQRLDEPVASALGPPASRGEIATAYAV